jgi:hypothetical protein
MLAMMFISPPTVYMQIFLMRAAFLVAAAIVFSDTTRLDADVAIARCGQHIY